MLHYITLFLTAFPSLEKRRTRKGVKENIVHKSLSPEAVLTKHQTKFKTYSFGVSVSFKSDFMVNLATFTVHPQIEDDNPHEMMRHIYVGLN